jgi:hypothetical protein
MKVKMFAAGVAALAIPALSATTGHVLVIPTITYSGSAGVDWFDDHLARDPNWIDGVGGPIDLMRPGVLHGRDGLGGHLLIPPYNYREQ